MSLIHSYRITKYSPQSRGDDGVFLKNEWTSISDIGRMFDGHLLTYEEYMHVEKKYVECVSELCKKCNVLSLRAVQVEDHRDIPHWKNGQDIDMSQLNDIIVDCLRENCWCKLQANEFFIHFGYDFYMYVGCAMGYQHVKKIAQNYELHAENYPSPYLA